MAIFLTVIGRDNHNSLRTGKVWCGEGPGAMDSRYNFASKLSVRSCTIISSLQASAFSYVKWD